MRESWIEKEGGITKISIFIQHENPTGGNEDVKTIVLFLALATLVQQSLFSHHKLLRVEIFENNVLSSSSFNSFYVNAGGRVNCPPFACTRRQRKNKKQ